MVTVAGGPRPSGVVTFVFTDVVGSTALWADDAQAMSASLELHDDVLRDVFRSAGGYVFTTAGDSFSVAFEDPAAAVGAAELVQRRLDESEWPGPRLEVRIGLHRSTAVERDGDYFGPGVNTAARIEAVGHGGQVLMSDAVASVVAPDADMVDLGLRRLRGVPDLVRIHQLGGRSHPPLRVPNDEVVRLPAPASPLIGRDADVRRVRERLKERRLVTLTGVGGTGKTRLAIGVAEREIPHFDGGVWFVDLAQVEDPDDLDGHAARSIGLSVGHDQSPSGRVIDQMSSRRALLVLDNCEHVIDAAAELADAILATRGDSRVLATSREALDVDGEAVVQVPSLAIDDEHGGDGSAARLFVERAHDAGVELASDPDTDRCIAELCARLDGMPLAIELAAARTTSMSPPELLDRLEDRFALLGRRRRGRGRQRTLESTIDWSYRLLDEEEQRFFRACGVFSGGFGVRAVASAAGVPDDEAIELIDSLIAKSLISTTTESVASPVIGRTSYRMLETIRAYAQDKLVDLDEIVVVQDRVASFFADGYDVLAPTWTSTFLSGFEEHESLISAYEHAVGRGDDDLARRLLAGVCGNAARWPPLPTAARFVEHPLVDPTTIYGRNALRAVGHDALQKCNGPVAQRAIERLAEAGGAALVSADVLDVFASGRRDPVASRESLDRADAAELGGLGPVESSWVRVYRAYGHWLHGDSDWMRREFSDRGGDWVKLSNPGALSMPGVIDVLDGRTREYRPTDDVRRAKSFLRTLDHALNGNRALVRDDLADARAHLTHDPFTGAAFPIFCSIAILTWALEEHDLTRRLLIAVGAPISPYACVIHHLGRLLGCEDEMLQKEPTPELMRRVGPVVLDHLDEVDIVIERMA